MVYNNVINTRCVQKGGEKMHKLAEFRKMLGLTQDKIASNINVSKSLYKKVEVGARKPSNSFISKIKKKYPQLDVNIFFIN